MKSEIQVSFCLTSKENRLNEIASLLKIKPTQMWSKGDNIKNTSMARKENGLCICYKSNKDLNIAKLITKSLSRFKNNERLLKQLIRKYKLDCFISCGVYIKQDTPIINFDKKFLNKLADLGVTLDIDII